MNPFSNSYTKDTSDKELIELILVGDKKSLSKLLERHQPFIYNLAWKMTGDPTLAEDLSQEAILKIITNIASFRFESSFRTWAYRIVSNHFINDQTKSKRYFANNFDDLGRGLDQAASIELNGEEQRIKADEIKEIRLQCLSGMLLCLNREQRLIYVMGEIFRADHNIGSEIMGISKANYRMKLSKARKDLYTFMQNKCGLVDKSNPCRCHKKVTVALENGFIDAKNLLFNKKEFSTFRESLEEDANYLVEESLDVYAKIHRNTNFKTNFEKEQYIKNLFESDNWKLKLNLNLN